MEYGLVGAILAMLAMIAVSAFGVALFVALVIAFLYLLYGLYIAFAILVYLVCKMIARLIVALAEMIGFAVEDIGLAYRSLGKSLNFRKGRQQGGARETRVLSEQRVAETEQRSEHHTALTWGDYARGWSYKHPPPSRRKN